MEILGYKIYENDLNLMKIVRRALDDPNDISIDFSEIRKIVDKYDVFEDYPWMYLYRWFDEEYPDTKFVFGYRPNADEWVKSIIYQTLRGKPERRRKTAQTHYWEYGFGKYPVLYEEQYKKEYLEHNKKVREYFKGRDDFLEVSWWNGDGWKELCSFLNKPIPDIPFPHKKNAWPYPNYEKLRQLALLNPEKFYGW